jgi:hypothetical protein
MKKINITMEMGDEVVTLSLNTNSTITDVIKHIIKIKEDDTLAVASIESLIEKEVLHDMGGIYESPDFGNTIYIKKKVK